jgi:PAS domain S-box-containing protein/diguanylate cyclase (GGDEF)-like protein
MDDPGASLKLLLVEDSAADVELVLRAMRGFPRPLEHVSVASEIALYDALAGFAPDVILSDFSMPGFSGKEALRIACKMAPQVPFLFVSGTIGEELAIDALRRGAVDYVLKDNLLRLPSAVERALDAARHRAERVRMEAELRTSEERFRTIVESSQDWIWESDIDGVHTYSNAAIARILGYSLKELLGVSAYELMAPGDREEAAGRVSRLIVARRGWQGWRLRWRHRDGSIRVLESTAIPCLGADGQVIGYRGVDRDITERLQQEARIQQLARIHAVLSALGNVVLRADDREKLLAQVCQVAVQHGRFAAARIGVASSEDGLQTAASFGDPSTIRLVEEYASRNGEGHEGKELWPGLRALKEARNVVVRDFALAEHVPAGVRREMAAAGISAQIALPIGTPPWGSLELYSPLPQEFNLEEIELLKRLVGEVDYAVDFLAKGERLEYLAYHHPVTGLLNRVAFQRQLAEHLAQQEMTVAVISLASFGRIIDSRGRDFGDQLLKAVARRLEAAVTPEMILAHVGEDAFFIAQPKEGGFEREVERLEGVLRIMDGAPYDMAGEQIYINFHGGVAVGHAHGTDGHTLERNATAALSEALKRKVRFESFTDRLREQSSRRVELERDLRRAVAGNEVELFYQPKFAADSARLIGAEALLRWRHPQHGMISPEEFIPILEDTGQIVQAGRWVMRNAIDTALAWRARGYPGFRIAVNVSARELRDANFLTECGGLLEPHATDQVLDVEVTESLLMEDVDQSIRLLESLRTLGCRIAIDDFGTGYSSLNYLVRLPADILKIDQSFVAQLGYSPETVGLVTNIITLAHSLSLRVVAEGVETEGQADLLRRLHCDELQGFLLGEPMPPEQFAACFL